MGIAVDNRTLRQRLAEVLLAAAMAISSFKGARFQEGYIGDIVLIWPMEFLRKNSLAIIGVLLLLVSLLSLASNAKLTRWYFWTGISLFLCKILVAVKESWFAPTLLASVSEGVVAFLIIFLVPLLVIAPGDPKSVSKAYVRIVVFAGLFFSAASLYLAVRQPVAAFWAGRLNGASAHPLFAALIFSACTYVTSIRAVFSENLWQRLWHLLLTMIFAGLTIATGSRSPLVALAGAYFISSFRNLKVMFAFVVSGIIFALVAYFAYKNIHGADLLLGTRVTTTDDTRSTAWISLWHNFTEYPLFGAPFIKTYSESSFLKYLARTGIIGIPSFVVFFFCWVFLLISALHCSIVLKVKSHVELAVLCTGISVYFMLFAVFEGFVWDVVSFSYLMFYLSIALSISLRASCKKMVDYTQ